MSLIILFLTVIQRVFIQSYNTLHPAHGVVGVERVGGALGAAADLHEGVGPDDGLAAGAPTQQQLTLQRALQGRAGPRARRHGGARVLLGPGVGQPLRRRRPLTAQVDEVGADLAVVGAEEACRGAEGPTRGFDGNGAAGPVNDDPQPTSLENEQILSLAKPNKILAVRDTR